ncbi:MAG: hypothetical protein PHE54_04065 [Bacilli bacterium]|nr:hypothetical protein [Bacilli bacterium]
MKHFFQIIGLLTIVCASFILTEKTSTVVKEADTIMVKIKENASKYSVAPVEAVITNNTVIPGINGLEVNQQKSYYEMKRIGTFNDQFLQYDEVAPSITIKGQYDKYVISGNKTIKQVALLFILDDDTEIDEILNKIGDNKVTFYITSVWLENNNETVLSLIKDGHSIGNLSYNRDYSHSDFIWMDTIIRKVGGQNIGFCYAPVETEQVLTTCSNNKNYTIIPYQIIEQNLFSALKKSLTNGLIIAIDVNNQTIKELTMGIEYIQKKGYNLVSLETMLSENYQK